jgi:hypothetical protein
MTSIDDPMERAARRAEEKMAQNEELDDREWDLMVQYWSSTRIIEQLRPKRGKIASAKQQGPAAAGGFSIAATFAFIRDWLSST